MTMQPMSQPQTPAGWYPDPRAAGVQRYWDGAAWTEHVAALPQQAPQQMVMVHAGTGYSSAHVSGLTTGGHLMHGVLTVCTLGLWAPVWGLVAFLGRRRVS